MYPPRQQLWLSAKAMFKIQESSIQDLHPTQVTVGLIEVLDKKKHLLSMKPEAQRSFLRDHPVPAVVGPRGRLYITDHHHLGRAALDAGVSTGFFEVEADLSNLGLDRFWTEMDKNLWVHPLDENGIRHYYSAIPHSLSQLIDDVYRSLAGYVRHAHAYEKTPTAFAEFVWADFFRRSIPIELVRADFKKAVDTGVSLARSHLAQGLPGYKPK